MSIYLVRRFSRSLILVAVIAVAAVNSLAQTPVPTPPPRTPEQQDATRPPGAVTQDPSAPPGTTRPDAQAPPGTTGDQTTPSQPMPGVPGGGQDSNPPALQIQPPPPLPPPDLTRLGITNDNPLTLSMNDAIRLALENNNDIEVSRDDVKINETTLRSLEGIFDPVFTLNPNYTSFVQSQQSALSGASTAGTVTQNNFQTDFSMNKQFSRGGGNYDFFFNNSRQTTDSTFNQLNPVYSSSLGVTITQPLWRNFKIDRNRHDIRIQRKRLQQSDADFRQKTINTISLVQRAYWDLVFAIRDQQNRVANLNLTRESLRNVEAKIAAGASAPLERAEVQVELSNRESELLVAVGQVSIAENGLKQLILRDPTAPQWTAQVVPTEQPAFDSTPVNLNDALEEAKTNRPELQRLRLQRDINSIDIEYFKNQTKPRVDFQSTLALTGLAGTAIVPTTSGTLVPLIVGNPLENQTSFLLQQINIIRNLPIVGLGNAIVPLVTSNPNTVPLNLQGGYGRNISNLFDFSTRNLVFGVTVQFPFFNKTAEANLAGARIQGTQLDASTRLQEQTIIVEVRNAAQSVETTRRVVITARNARENAEIQLAGEQRLYQVGRSTTFLLFQRENALANARNLELRAETEYNKALADLQRATSTTLRTFNITVVSPTQP